MEEIFQNQSKLLVKNLATQAVLRIRLEVREQVLFQKTLNLNRFIRLASLHHLKDSPEMANANKILGIVAQQNNWGNMKEVVKLLSDGQTKGDIHSALN